MGRGDVNTRQRDMQLTERQRQVLQLMAAGKTNAEIGEALGISLDGAKWHVSEILMKFDVPTREDAVQFWRSERSLGRRVVRGLRVLLAPVMVHKTVAATLAAAVVGLAGTGIFFAVRGSSTPTSVSPNELRPSTTSDTPAPVSPGELPPSPTFGRTLVRPYPFGKMQMFDENAGWGTIGSHAYVVYSYFVVRSDDGGRTWTDASPNLGDKTAIQTAFFLDAQRAWVLVDDNTSVIQTDNARVAWTSDGGKTWTAGRPLGPRKGVAQGKELTEQIAFVDSQHGWVFENDAALYQTTDGGASWEEVSTTAGTNTSPAARKLPASCMPVLAFADTTHGFAAGSCPDNDSGPPLFFRSDDAGKTWQRQSLPDPGRQVRCPCYLGPPSFPTPADGFVVVLTLSPDSNSLKDGSIRNVYATHDGGRTWVLVGEPHSTTAYLVLVKFLDPMDGWIVEVRDNGSTNFRTQDAGKTWQQLPAGPYIANNFISPTEGWTLDPANPTSDRSPVLHTLDGGQTWQPVGP